MLRSALLFIPAHDPDMRKWMVALWGYCARRMLQPEAVVHEWADVLKLWRPGMRVVVARRDHADWLDVVSEDPGEPLPERRRPCRTSEERPPPPGADPP